MLIIPTSPSAAFGCFTKGCLTQLCMLTAIYAMSQKLGFLKTVVFILSTDSLYSWHLLVLCLKYLKQQVAISSVALNTHCASRVDLIRQAIQSSRGHQSSSDGKSNKSFEGLKVIYGQNVRRNEQK